MEAKREVGNMLVLLQVCGLVCTYVNIFMRTYDATFHCASCSISQTSKDLKTIDINLCEVCQQSQRFEIVSAPLLWPPVSIQILKKQQNLTCDEVEHAVSQQQKHALWMAYLEMLVH